MKKGKIKIWELSLLMALSITLCWGVRVQAQQQALTEKIIRMHVIAQSDEADEQALKLRVRDAVMEKLAPLVAESANVSQAKESIGENLEFLRDAALSASEGRDVTVEFGTEDYGTRQSDECTLPAGVYTSLRVIIGEGEGHNWWGVIFPQLTGSDVVSYSEAVNILGEKNVAIITEGKEGFEIRFRLLEWLDSLMKWNGLRSGA